MYYLSSCASGRITRILLADVSGHGELVASTAAALRDLMQKNVNRISQRRFVAAMNQQFAATSAAGSFATAIVNSFFAPTQALSVCNAGHPNPLLYRAALQEWITVDWTHSPGDSEHAVTDLPLGIIHQVGYREMNLRLDKGDRVLCYSDAFSDARGSDGKPLGVEGVRRAAASMADIDAHEFLSRLSAAIQALHPGNLSQDDATLVFFCANGTRTLLRDDLLAPFRLFRKARDASHIEPCSLGRPASSGFEAD
ncbi:MAG: serine/threonine-protein phosphatase [Thermoguttaceae bacterium]|nr:serine/threonine-protein phosphatase [Thermoguttaceae bacterium]